MTSRCSTKRLMFLVMLITWTRQVNGQSGCSSAASPVADMCSGDSVSGARIFIDTTRAQVNCSCFLQTTANTLEAILIAAPNTPNCRSRLDIRSSTPESFRCAISGKTIDVSTMKNFDINFVKDVPYASHDYCLAITANALPGELISTVRLVCRPPILTTTTPTTTTSTTTTTTTPRPIITYTPFNPITFTYTPRVTSMPRQTTWKGTYGSSTQSTRTTTVYTYTGFPNSVSQTASEPMFKVNVVVIIVLHNLLGAWLRVIIICSIVGAGLLVAIIIAIAAIMGKRRQPRRNANKNRFSLPANSNLDNGNNTYLGHKRIGNGFDDRSEDFLHRAVTSSHKKHPSLNRMYDNKGYDNYEHSRNFSTLVVSERL